MMDKIGAVVGAILGFVMNAFTSFGIYDVTQREAGLWIYALIVTILFWVRVRPMIKKRKKD